MSHQLDNKVDNDRIFFYQFMSKAIKTPSAELVVEASKRVDLGIEPRTSHIYVTQSANHTTRPINPLINFMCLILNIYSKKIIIPEDRYLT